ncbi:MAG TPA: TRAP transporter large permease [bacterium]|nr:TRAP transporter large permease [bacterium]HOL47165.1 TRAP transporter large permease [bacterium]HPQ18088.1 TRAP transporter large permease [bacterium]
MNFIETGIFGFIILIIFIFLNIPVGFAMAIIGFIGYALIVNFNAALSMIALNTWDVFSSYSLTVIPLFIFMGQIAFHSGISKGLFRTAYVWIGSKKGGLAMATIVACAGFSAICGSTNAAAATMATIAIPEMKRYHYNPKLAAGTVAAAGSLGILIPPSVIFIIYGIMTQQSIGKLFAAGILPGILLTLLFILVIYIWLKINPSLAPSAKDFSIFEKVKSLTDVFETLLLFVLIMGGMFTGFFTPTEAAAIGAFFTIVISFFRKQLSINIIIKSLADTAKISCMIMTIVLGAEIFGKFLAVTRLPFEIASLIASLNLPSYIIMSLIVLMYIIGGCFMDSLAMIMLTVPIFFPIINSLGFDPIWFGVIIVLVTQIGVITPPVGINVYIVHSVANDVKLEEIFLGAMPLLLALLVCCILLFIFPQIATFLPSIM